MYSNKKAALHSRSVFVDEPCSNIDYKYGPYDTVELAFKYLTLLEVKAVGLTVGINTNDGIVEYWFKKTPLTMDNFVMKGVMDEEDPVFSASPAAAITTNDIEYWNEGAHFTEDLLAAVDSGITSEKVAQYDSMIGLTAAQSKWLNSQILGELQKAADEAISLVQSNGTLVFYKDKITDSPTSTTTVYLSYNSNNILADETPTSWTYDSDNIKYTYNITTSSSAPVTEFSYTFTDGDYKDLTVTKKSSAKSISIINPAWYGLLEDISSIDKIVSYVNSSDSPLTRITSGINNTSTSFSTSTSKYLVIITKNSASATLLGMSIISKKYDIPSDYTTKEYLLGYKIYVTSNVFSDDFSANITISL